MNITQFSGESLTMTSREIADLVGSRHDNVRVTIERLAEKGVIALPALQEKATAGRPAVEYVFSGQQGKRSSLIVVAQLCPEFTARIVDRWQELESLVSMPALNPANLSRLQLIELAMQAEQERLALEVKATALESKVAEQEPKVAFARQVEVAPDAIDVCKAAQLLGTGRNRLMQFLREKHWVTRYNQPYQDKIDAGLLNTKLSRPYEHPERGLQQSVTTLVTGKGLVKLRQLWDERQKAISDAWMLSKSANNQEVRHAR